MQPSDFNTILTEGKKKPKKTDKEMLLRKIWSDNYLLVQY